MAPDLWTCPRCGRRFVTANTYHSCGRFALEDHFERRIPAVRATFDALVEIVEGFGPVTVYAQKTRIVFQARTRFTAIVTRRRWLLCQIWLKRLAEHPRMQRLERYTYRDFGHILRLDRPDQIDDALIAMLHEAYIHGSS